MIVFNLMTFDIRGYFNIYLILLFFWSNIYKHFWFDIHW